MISLSLILLLSFSSGVFSASFDSDSEGFVYVDDAFRATANPAYADGSYQASAGFSGGALQIDLGGVDPSDVFGLSGGWTTNVDVASASDVTISLRYKLDQSGAYESSEFSQVLLGFDGSLFGTAGNDYIVQITGDGNEGPTQSTGWQQFQVTVPNVAPGTHQLMLGAYNNQKTFDNELTQAWIDDVVVTLPPLDAVAPTVALDAPTDNANVSDQVNVDATANDNIGIAQVEFFVDGNSIAVDDTAPYAISWNSFGVVNGQHQISATVTDPSGNSATDTVNVTVNNSGVPVQRYEYVFLNNHMDIFDIDNNHQFVRSVNYPPGEVRGAIASAVTGALFISTLGNGGTIIKIDLATDQIVWERSYADGIDSAAISPDGRRLYQASETAGIWNVIDTDNGDILSSINGPQSPHNTVISDDGLRLYMGGGLNELHVASTVDNVVVQIVKPLETRIRPFTINGQETLAYMTVSSFLGFQVGDINTGEVLYTVEVNGFPSDGTYSQSHGISLSPDETEVYVNDATYNYVHVFDVTDVPNSAPVQVADIPLTGNLSHGWLHHSKDGNYVYVGHAGDVIDTTTRTTIAFLPSMQNSQKMLEIHFQNGVPSWAANNRVSTGRVK